jgi:hypothetical protein
MVELLRLRHHKTGGQLVVHVCKALPHWSTKARPETRKPWTFLGIFLVSTLYLLFSKGFQNFNPPLNDQASGPHSKSSIRYDRCKSLSGTCWPSFRELSSKLACVGQRASQSFSAAKPHPSSRKGIDEAGLCRRVPSLHTSDALIPHKTVVHCSLQDVFEFRHV